MKNEEVKILSLKAENVKKLEAVQIVFNEDGLTTIGGGNGAGKTSVLDSIVWALGGDKYKPSNFMHDGAASMNISMPLSNGVLIERKGKNGALKVSGGDGKQSLLDTFYGALTLDLPKFMAAKEKEKTDRLLEAFPELAHDLQKLDEKISVLFYDRTIVGRDRDQKSKYADELMYHDEAPEAPLSGADMAKKLQAALGLNARNEEIRRTATQKKREIENKADDSKRLALRVSELEDMLAKAKRDQEEVALSVKTAKAAYDEAVSKTTGLVDKDTSEIERELEEIDIINAKVRDNQNRLMAKDAAAELGKNYVALSNEIEELRQKRVDLLQKTEMPLDGMSIDEEGRLTYTGKLWDCMATSEQYRVAVALCAALKPSCKFVLLDRLECLDRKELASFDGWLKECGLQGIATRVSEGNECHIIIEEGLVATPVKRKYSL